jgi:hypothetical protein
MFSIVGKLARSMRLIIVACIVTSSMLGCLTACSQLATLIAPCPDPELDIVNPNLSIEMDAQRARDILKTEVKRWTEIEIHHALAQRNLLLQSIFSNIEYYLLYFSPQLIQAAVLDISAAKNYTLEQQQDLLASVDQRLRQQGELPFLLVVRSDQRISEVHLASLRNKMTLVNLNGESVRPSRYDRSLDDPLQLPDLEMKIGFVFFPLQFDDCRPTVDLRRDSSFSIMLEDAEVVTRTSPFTHRKVSKDLSWRFSLVGLDKSVVDLLDTPVAMPPEIEQTFDDEVLMSALELVLELALDLALGTLLP